MSSKSVISIEPHDEVIHAVVNRSDLKDSALDQLQTEISSAAAQHPGQHVVLDLTQVKYVPSMGLGALVMLMRHLKTSNQRLLLVGLQPEVRTVLAITRLDKLFEIHPDFATALEQLRSATSSSRN
jgi:anti-anti-sigma factor